jgi:formylglycine-generating enzyme required for sulfatase activity
MRYLRPGVSVLTAFMMLLLISCATGKNTTPGEDAYPGMVEIPKGWFVMGMDNGELNEKPEHEVFLLTFWIDKYEVTAKDFAEFLNEKGNPDDRYFSHDKYSTVVGVSNRNGRYVETDQDPEKYIPRQGFENYPANNVSWYGAEAYCNWKGKRLPTEAEWEKAARGDDKRIFPWGSNMPDATRARYNQKWEEKQLNVMVPVDALNDGTSYYGLYNMAGNVWEWVNDWYRQNYCDYCISNAEYYEVAGRLTGSEGNRLHTDAGQNMSIPPMDDPQGPEVGSFKVLRGGSWYDSCGEFLIRATYRYWFYPEDRYLNTGFRCSK